MASRRRLRLLLINDQDPGRNFRAPFIEVVECPTGFRDDVKPRLATWDQHIWLWGKGQVPNFDLLLIDIKFERDTTDPSYFGEAGGPQLLTPPPPDRVPNPFGLLHALPLVARQDLTNMPFVWGVHSGDPRTIQNDPVAIWALGLLYAMECREGWDGDGYYSKPTSLSAYFQTQLETMQSLNPQQAWRSLLLPYRTRLLEACKARVYVEPNSLQRLIVTAEEIAQAAGNPTEALDRLANDCLFLYAGYEDTHALILRSLFADVERWDRHTVGTEVLGYLCQLREATAHFHIFPQVDETIRKLAANLDADPDDRRTLMDVLPRTPNRARIAVGVIVCLWLRRFCRGEGRRPHDLLFDMGFVQEGKSENAHAPNRLLCEAYGIDKMARGKDKMTLGTFLQKLERGPLETVWRECGLKYYNIVLLEENGEGQWPAWLGSE